MRLTLIAITLLMASGGTAGAVPDDAMAVQRCVFRCDYATRGKQPAYDRCVATKCNGTPRKRR